MSSNTLTSRVWKSGVRRHRTITSCQLCRVRRIKCDRTHPVCSNCAKNSTECVWVVNTPHSASSAQRKRRASVAQSGVDHGQSRDDISLDGNDSGPGNPDDDQHTDSSLGDNARSPRPGYLTLQNGGRSRYVSDTFWANIDNEVVELDELLSKVPTFPLPLCYCGLAPYKQPHISAGSQSENEGLAPPNRISKVNAGSEYRGEMMYSLAQLLNLLPPKEICDDLYHNFLDIIHPITPLLHIPTFQSQYTRFWQWYLSWDREELPTGILAEIPSFLPLFLAVLFAGSFGQPTPLFNQDATEASLSGMTAQLYQLHSHALALVSFPQSPTIYSLIAYLMAQNLLIREEESLSSCSYLSVALRIAQAMGLHRDGALFKLDPIQAELRRRIWWHIIHTDIMTCLSSGLPPLMVLDNFYDTRMISEFKDEYISISQGNGLGQGQKQDAARSPTPDDQMLDIRYVVAVGRYKLTALLRKVLRHQFDVRAKSAKEFAALKKVVDEQSADTAARIERIAAMQLTPTPSDHEVDGRGAHGMPTVAFQTWAQKLLWLMNHRSYCMLYQPLLKGEGECGDVNSVRKDAIRHCHAYVENFLDMCTTPEFRPFYWLYPGTYQPLQAMAILLSDLLRNPQSEEAQHSRTLVERLFSMVGSDGVGWYKDLDSRRNLSTAGKEVWKMLRRLRRQAWKKAGLDPDIVWIDNNLEHSANNTATAAEGSAAVDPLPPPPVDSTIFNTENSEQKELYPVLEDNTAAKRPDTNNVLVDFLDNPDLELGDPALGGQFSHEEIDYLDWGEWDSLVDRYFNMPDPGQINF
ncbi:fungal-specific transcription factor domain-containing protein [Xylogone sp. PMI_703]|nr:fungal-specific transcription factor domain-containing protein [Xylogone sp. PMI_703]